MRVMLSAVCFGKYLQQTLLLPGLGGPKRSDSTRPQALGLPAGAGAIEEVFSLETER